MKYLFSTLIFALSFSVCFAQTEEEKAKQMWQTLGQLTFKKQFDEFMGFKVDVPVFSDEVKNLDGQEVIIRGYIIPTEGYKSHTSFVFSAYPYNMCYFCGGAGPETVMEVETVEPIEYTAEPIVIKGILHTNSGDINRLFYSLTEATFVSK
ncbi:MAG: hypothetical protein ACPG5P_08305 [Saprospiraceae bacterium]